MKLFFFASARTHTHTHVYAYMWGSQNVRNCHGHNSVINGTIARKKMSMKKKNVPMVPSSQPPKDTQLINFDLVFQSNPDEEREKNRHTEMRSKACKLVANNYFNHRSRVKDIENPLPFLPFQFPTHNLCCSIVFLFAIVQ